jgi:hypothetical protein
MATMSTEYNPYLAGSSPAMRTIFSAGIEIGVDFQERYLS